MDHNHLEINIWLNMRKIFLTTRATQPDPCGTCIFLTNQSIREAMEWAFHHLGGKQGIFNYESLELSDYNYLLSPYCTLPLCNNHKCNLFLSEVYHIRNHFLRKEGC